MEKRTIMVANTKTQKRCTIESNATTLGELKRDFDAAGIDYSGMTFTEGISKTSLLDDASQLPTNILYKGKPTNNLVILLTNTKKNIASGALDRKEAYAIINDCGNELKEFILNVTGQNYTRVKTEELFQLIKRFKDSEVEVDDEDDDYEDDEAEEVEKENTEVVEEMTLDEKNTVNHIYDYVKFLTKNNDLSSVAVEALIELLAELNNRMQAKDTVSMRIGDEVITEDDICEMINDVM